jgi:hypothetical protein
MQETMKSLKTSPQFTKLMEVKPSLYLLSISSLSLYLSPLYLSIYLLSISLSISSLSLYLSPLYLSISSISSLYLSISSLLLYLCISSLSLLYPLYLSISLSSQSPLFPSLSPPLPSLSAFNLSSHLFLSQH